MNLEKLQNNSGPIKGQHDRTELNLKLKYTDKRNRYNQVSGAVLSAKEANIPCHMMK